MCSAVPRVLQLWKDSLVAGGKPKIAQSLADPTEYTDMFPDYEYGLQAEAAVKASSKVPASARSYRQWTEVAHRDIISGNVKLAWLHPSACNVDGVMNNLIPGSLLWKCRLQVG